MNKVVVSFAIIFVLAVVLVAGSISDSDQYTLSIEKATAQLAEISPDSFVVSHYYRTYGQEHLLVDVLTTENRHVVYDCYLDEQTTEVFCVNH